MNYLQAANGQEARPEYINVRSLKVKAREQGKSTLDDILEEVTNQETWRNQIERVTPNVEQGVFAITFKTRDAKSHIETDWKERNAKGELKFTIVQEEQQEAEQSFVLGKLPEEYPRSSIRSFMHQYCKNPRVTAVMHPRFTWLDIGQVKVIHDGLKRPLTPTIWIGPYIRGQVISSTTKIPFEQVGPKCTKCLSFGHVFQECDQEQRCLKCTKVGHVARECIQCSWCLKWGHKEEVCYSKKKGNQRKEKRRRAVQNRHLTTEQSEGMEQVHEDKSISSDSPSNIKNEKPVDEESVDFSTPPPNQEQFHQQQCVEKSNRQNVIINSNKTDETETENKTENENEIYGLNISMTEDDMIEDDSRTRKRTHSDVDKDENEIGQKVKEVREREHK